MYVNVEKKFMKKVITLICLLMITCSTLTMYKKYYFHGLKLKDITPQTLAYHTTKYYYTLNFWGQPRPLPGFAKELENIQKNNPDQFKQFVCHFSYLLNKNNPDYLSFKNEKAWKDFWNTYHLVKRQWKYSQKTCMIITFIIIGLLTKCMTLLCGTTN